MISSSVASSGLSAYVNQSHFGNNASIKSALKDETQKNKALQNESQKNIIDEIRIVKKTQTQDIPQEHTQIKEATKTSREKSLEQSELVKFQRELFSNKDNKVKEVLSEKLGISNFSSKVQKLNYYKESFASNMQTLLTNSNSNPSSANIQRKSVYA